MSGKSDDPVPVETRLPLGLAVLAHEVTVAEAARHEVSTESINRWRNRFVDAGTAATEDGRPGRAGALGSLIGRRRRAEIHEFDCGDGKTVVMAISDPRTAVASLRLQAVTFDVADAIEAAAFWAGLLDREVVMESGATLLPGDERQVGLRFITSKAERVGRPRLHVHLTSNSLEDQRRTVETALRLGGRHLDVGQGADDDFVVLADPAGNELCVLEPGNNFLAGTGRLGEVTCDGSRAVGLFWRDALGWPLVWDENEQTAIQSPLGGTKISWDSWGRSRAGLETGNNRQRFDLVSAEPAREADRLVSLGAAHLAQPADRIRLADPDGNEFGLYAG